MHDKLTTVLYIFTPRHLLLHSTLYKGWKLSESVCAWTNCTLLFVRWSVILDLSRGPESQASMRFYQCFNVCVQTALFWVWWNAYTLTMQAVGRLDALPAGALCIAYMVQCVYLLCLMVASTVERFWSQFYKTSQQHIVWRRFTCTRNTGIINYMCNLQ